MQILIFFSKYKTNFNNPSIVVSCLGSEGSFLGRFHADIGNSSQRVSLQTFREDL